MVTAGRCVLVWLALGAVSCGGAGSAGTAADIGSTPDRAGAGSPLDGEWDLVEWTEQGEPLDHEQVRLEAIRMSVDGPTTRGQAPCNHYDASLEIDDTSLQIEVDSWTAVACGGDADDEPYFEALERIRAYERDGDRLVLTGAGTRLVYEEILPPPDSSLAGTRWQLHSFYQRMPDMPDAATAAADVPEPDGEPPTLVLHHDGAFTVDTRCREVTGRWQRDGDQLHLTDVVAGDGACGDSRLEEAEAAQLEVLGSRMELEIEGPGLDLWAGELGLGYTDRSADPRERSP